MPLLSTRIFPYFELATATVVAAVVPPPPAAVVPVGAVVVAAAVPGEVDGVVVLAGLELLEHAASAMAATAATAK
jgi:hypothetical protein